MPYSILYGSRLRNEDRRSFLEQCRWIDWFYFEKDRSEEDAHAAADATPEVEQVLEWMEKEPDIRTFLVEDTSGKVAGYVEALALEESTFLKVRGGMLVDSELSASDVRPFGHESRHIYFMSIAIHPDHRAAGLFDPQLDRLLGAFFEMLHDRGVRPMSIVAVAWSDSGLVLCELLGMESTGNKERNGKDVFGLTEPEGVELPLPYSGLRDLVLPERRPRRRKADQDTMFDRLVRKLKDHPFWCAFLFILFLVILAATLVDAIDKLQRSFG